MRACFLVFLKCGINYVTIVALYSPGIFFIIKNIYIYPLHLPGAPCESLNWLNPTGVDDLRPPAPRGVSDCIMKYKQSN